MLTLQTEGDTMTKTLKTTIISFSILLFAFLFIWLGATRVSAADGDACASNSCDGTYKNGFCTKCDGYEEPLRDEDGNYLIDNAGKLYWLTIKSNGNLYTKNAKLTADIVVNENVVVDGALNTDASVVASFRPWKPENIVKNLFDGQGHTISGLYISSSSDLGLFSEVSHISSVKNLGVINSYFVSDGDAQPNAGGIASKNSGTISNCFSNVIIYTDGYDATGFSTTAAGGIAGYNHSSGKIENCYFTGNISGSAEAGGTAASYFAKVNIGGIVGENKGTVANCYSTGSLTSNGATATDPSKEFENVGGIIGENLENGSSTNCYYLDNSETDELDGTAFKTIAQFNSGEVAYLLNSGVTDGTQAFYQTTGIALPVFEGKTVLYILQCDGTTWAYTNTTEHDKSIVEAKYFNEDGTCKVCGTLAEVKVSILTIIIGSTPIYDIKYYSDIMDAFLTPIGTVANSAQITLLKDVSIANNTINISDSNIVLDTQGFNIDSISVFGVFSLSNSSLTISGNGTVKNPYLGLKIENGSNATVSDNVKIVGFDAIKIAAGGSFTMTGGSIEGTNAITYESPDKIIISGGSIIGTLKDTKVGGSANQPVISGVTFPSGITLSSDGSSTLENLLEKNYLYCDENNEILDSNVKSMSGKITVKKLTDVLNDIKSSVQNGKDGITPLLRINEATNEWEASYDNGATWSTLGIKATGEKGEQGETGPQGAQGEKGEQGETGPQGEQGEKGETGLQGVAGSQGVRGEKGETGPQGIQGERGETGPQGIQGEKGDAAKNGLVIASIIIAIISLAGNVALVVWLVISKRKS